MQSPTPELIGAEAAAAILDVHRTTVWRFKERGQLTAIPVHGAKGTVFDRAEVQALADTRARVADRRAVAS